MTLVLVGMFLFLFFIRGRDIWGCTKQGGHMLQKAAFMIFGHHSLKLCFITLRVVGHRVVGLATSSQCHSCKRMTLVTVNSGQSTQPGRIYIEHSSPRYVLSLVSIMLVALLCSCTTLKKMGDRFARKIPYLFRCSNNARSPKPPIGAHGPAPLTRSHALPPLTSST